MSESDSDKETHYLGDADPDTSGGASGLTTVSISCCDSVEFRYCTEAVTIVSGIHNRINLANLCDSAPSIFGVHSQCKRPF